jgi:hypothetical protein
MFIEISTFCAADVVKKERGEMYKLKKGSRNVFGCIVCI